MANDEKAITNPSFLLETVKVDQLKGLEIGPLTASCNQRGTGSGEIFYLDHLSTDELEDTQMYVR